MSDDQNNDNLTGSEPKERGGWHQPTETSLWNPPEEDTGSQAPFVLWNAFPEDVTDRPQEQGGWHLPSPEDTTLTPDMQLTKGELVDVPARVDPEFEAPEDIINRLLGERPTETTKPAQSTPVVAPEDFEFPSQPPEDVEVSSEAEFPAVVAPEDFEFPSQPPEDVELDIDTDEDVPDEEEEEDIVEDMLDDALENMEDGDPFDEDELTALQQMVSDEELGDSADEEEDEFDALNRIGKKITDDLEPTLGESSNVVEVPTVSSDDDASQAAKEARKMLQQFEDEESVDEEDDLPTQNLDITSIYDDEEALPTDGLFGGTSALSPKEAAQQALQDLENDGGGYGTETTLPLPGQQQIPQLDPDIREHGEAFRKAQNQFAVVRNLYNNEEMSFDDYQRALYENMVQDENGVWWTVNAENGKWNRHDTVANQWVDDYPPALLQLEEYEQAVQSQPESLGNMLDGNTSTSAPTAFDLPPIDGPQPGDPIYDSQGVQIGEVPETFDPEYTQVGSSAFKDQLTGQQDTFVNMDAGYDATVPAPSTLDATVPIGGFESRAQGFDNVQGAIDTSGPSDFSQLDEPVPTVDNIRNEQRNRTIQVFVFAALGVVALGLIFVILGGIGIVLWYNNAVDPYRAGIAALADYDPPFQTARIFDANGDLIVELNSSDTGARTAISLDEMSPYIIHAVVSQENERYYEDPGFDPIAIVRAFIQNIAGGEIQSGASTITQQIAKNLVLQDSEVTAERKINEVLIALEIANQYDKNFILELYLNEVFFGNQSYGVESASQFYFGHGADELNYAESALLASIVPSPASNDPVVNRPTAIRNMRATMSKMLEVGCLQFQHGDWVSRGSFCITEDTTVEFDGDDVFLLRLNDDDEIIGGLVTVQIAEIETIEFQPRNVRLQYPHFVNYIQAEIEAEFGTNALFQRGFNIYTTLIPGVQDVAQDALTRQVEVLVDTGVNTGAVMVTDPNTGAIRAMVGSHDFTDEVAGQVNNALTYQQPGSSIKPIVYAAGLIGNQGNYLTPASILWDVPVTYDIGGGQTYTPVNFDRRFHGPTPLRFALQNSYNVAAVKAYAQVGNQKFLEVAQAFGLQFPEGSQLGLASALGANEVRLIDMMEAYGTFANAGQRAELYAIERITETSDGAEVEVARAARAQPTQVISPQVAYLMQNILSDDNARSSQFGTGSNLTLARLGFPARNYVSAKTGTSNDSRDLWTMGFTRNVVVGVWLGTYDNSATFGTTGFNSASPVWNITFEAALRGRTPPEFQNPGGIIVRDICRTTGTLVYDSCPQRTTDIFIQDKFPPAPDQGFVQTIAIDSWSGLRANEFCDDYVTEGTFASINDPSAVDWLNTTNEGRAYAQQVGLPIPLQAPPANECSQGQTLPSVSVSAPNANSTVQGEVAILGQAQGPNFARYELSYVSASNPNTFFPITTSQTQVTTNGSELGRWNTLNGSIPNGQYIIRLTAVSTVNGTIVIDVPVTVDNPVPTATPQPLPTSTPFDSSGVPAGSSPIPFQNEGIQFESLPAPTFTPLGG